MVKARRDWRALACFAAGVVVIFGCGAPPPPADPNLVRFVFAPPDGTSFVETLEATQRTSIEGHSETTSRSTAKSRAVIRRLDDDTYEVQYTLLSMEMRRNGRKVRDPISPLLEGRKIRMRVDANGHALDVTGFDQVESAIRGTLPAAAFEAAKQILSADAMAAKAMAEWNGRYAAFAGREMRVGEVQSWTSTYTLPGGGAINYDVHTKVDELVPCAENPCARIRQSYDSEAEALGIAMSEIGDRVAASIGTDMELPSIDQPQVVGTIDRLVDPANLLVYDEVVRRTILSRMRDSAGNEAMVTREETRSYSFSFE